MEAPPPLSAAPISAATPASSQPPPSAPPDSANSSPRSHTTDNTWITADTSLPHHTAAKLRLMCSYGGHIVPRPHDKSLCYVGGDTRIIVVDRRTSLSDLSVRLSKTLLNGRSFTLKYQLPNEDLDSLISIATDEDLENMIDEYDRIAGGVAGVSSAKASRLRLFLFSVKSDSGSSIGSLLEGSTKAEDWFLNALNGASVNSSTKVFSESSSVNCLLGLDDDVDNSGSKDGEAQLDGSFNGKGGGKIQDVHSVPDSPMLETNSSFGSTSSTPSLANLPPIRVKVVEENPRVGIEEQFAQMTVGGVGVGGGILPQQKLEDGAGLMGLASPPAPSPPVVVGIPPAVGEFPTRIVSDDERSDHGVPVGGLRKPPQPQLMQQQPPQFPQQPSISQQKPAGPIDLPSPDSVSSDASLTNPLLRQMPVIYQEPAVQIQSGNDRSSSGTVEPKITDPNSRVQLPQQVQESGYVLPNQFDQHPQLLQQPQFVHGGMQYIHHHPSGPVPVASYYPVYPSQQQHLPHQTMLDHQYPVYYMSARQAQAYNLPVQQQSYNESAAAAPSSHPQTPPAASMVPASAAYSISRNALPSKPELPVEGYRTTATATPHLVQVPSSSQHQPQYVGYSQIHPSQTIAPASTAMGNYAYEFADPTRAQIYYTQPLSSQMASQYKTMTSAPAMVLPEGSALISSENIKQQVTSSQS